MEKVAAIPLALVGVCILLLLGPLHPALAQITVYSFPNQDQREQLFPQNQSIPAPFHAVNTTSPDLQSQIQNLESQLSQKKSLFITQQKEQEQRLLQPILAYDKIKNCATDQHMPLNTTGWYKTYLTDFRCGHVHVASNGTVYRDFTLLSDDYGLTGKPIPISLNKTDPIIFHGWTFNNTIPGPTIRVTVGDHVRINLFNARTSGMAHGMHMHSIHSGYNDGVPGISPGGLIFPGGNFTFNFVAGPVGNFPYHCHMSPIEEHISRGLYGMLIIDPISPRPMAKEMVMTLTAYSFSTQGLDGKGTGTSTAIASIPCTMAEMRHNLSKCIDGSDENNLSDNQFYTVNGMPFGYDPMHGGTPIHLNTDQRYRIYLENMVEFDPINNFHMHGTMFYFTRSGTFSDSIFTDIVALMQADRGILQFTYPYKGEYMMHSHLAHFSDLGWTGFFLVDNDKSYGFFK